LLLSKVKEKGTDIEPAMPAAGTEISGRVISTSGNFASTMGVHPASANKAQREAHAKARTI
jgi:hypothetical protein